MDDEIVVSAEETVGTSHVKLEDFEVHYLATEDDFDCFNEIHVQESVEIHDESNLSLSEKSSSGRTGEPVFQKILKFTEKHRGRPPKFDVSEIDEQGRAWYTCTVCDLRTNGRRDLLQHMRTHDKERPFFCKECGSNFKQVVHLRAHMRMHTGEKPFQCSVCGKYFRQKVILDQHMRTHTQDKPYKCTEAGCTKEFTQKTSLKNHLKSHRTGKLSELYGKKDPLPMTTQSKIVGSVKKPAVTLTSQSSVQPLQRGTSDQPASSTTLSTSTGITLSRSQSVPFSFSTISSPSIQLQNLNTAVSSPTSASGTPRFGTIGGRPVTQILDNRPKGGVGRFKTTVVQMTPTQFKEYLSVKYPKLHRKTVELENASQKQDISGSNSSELTTNLLMQGNLATEVAKDDSIISCSSSQTDLNSVELPSCSDSLEFQPEVAEVLDLPKPIVVRSASNTSPKDVNLAVNYSATSFENQEKSSVPERQKEATGPFLAYVNLNKPQLQAERPSLTLIQLLEELAGRWNRLPPDEKAKFAKLAKEDENIQKQGAKIDAQSGGTPENPFLERQTSSYPSQTKKLLLPKSAINSPAFTSVPKPSKKICETRSYSRSSSTKGSKTRTPKVEVNNEVLLALNSVADSVFDGPGSENQVVLKQFPHQNGSVYEVAMEKVNIEGHGPGEKNNIVIISPVKKLRTYPSPKRPLGNRGFLKGSKPSSQIVSSEHVIDTAARTVCEELAANVVQEQSHQTDLGELSMEHLDSVDGRLSDMTEDREKDLGERADISNDENLNEMASGDFNEIANEDLNVISSEELDEMATQDVNEEIIESNVSFVIEDTGELRVLEDSGILSCEPYDESPYDVQDNIENLYSIYQL